MLWKNLSWVRQSEGQTWHEQQDGRNNECSVSWSGWIGTNYGLLWNWAVELHNTTSQWQLFMCSLYPFPNYSICWELNDLFFFYSQCCVYLPTYLHTHAQTVVGDSGIPASFQVFWIKIYIRRNTDLPSLTAPQFLQWYLHYAFLMPWFTFLVPALSTHCSSTNGFFFFPGEWSFQKESDGSKVGATFSAIWVADGCYVLSSICL